MKQENKKLQKLKLLQTGIVINIFRVIVIVVVLGIGIALIFTQRHKHNGAKPIQQTQELQGLQQQLDKIQQELAQANTSDQNVQQIKAKLLVLAQNIADIKQNGQETKDATQKGVQVSQQNYQTSQKQLAWIKAQLNLIHKQLMPIKYLPVKVLPFKTVGLDFWNGKPMVTVALKDANGSVNYRLLAQDMVFSHWKLIKVRTNPNIAIFQNQKHQQVKVEL